MQLINRISSTNLTFARHYSFFDRNKRFYQLTIDEDEKPRKPTPVADIEARVERSKKKLLWRVPLAQNMSFFTFGLGMFKSDVDKAQRMQDIAKPIDWSVRGLREQHERKMKAHTILSQSFIHERHRILGNDLAAAHFIMSRGGQVRYVLHLCSFPIFLRLRDSLQFHQITRMDEGRRRRLPQSTRQIRSKLPHRCNQMRRHGAALRRTGKYPPIVSFEIFVNEKYKGIRRLEPRSGGRQWIW